MGQLFQRRLAMDRGCKCNVVFVDALQTCTVQLSRDASVREKRTSNEALPKQSSPPGDDTVLVQAEAGGAQESSQRLSREFLGLRVKEKSCFRTASIDVGYVASRRQGFEPQSNLQGH